MSAGLRVSDGDGQREASEREPAALAVGDAALVEVAEHPEDTTDTPAEAAGEGADVARMIRAAELVQAVEEGEGFGAGGLAVRHEATLADY